MQVRAVLLAAALMLAPPAARAADLTVWWTKGFYPEEDDAIRRVVADFERETGTVVELDLFPLDEFMTRLLAALSAGQPPDVVFTFSYGGHQARWAAEGLLLDLSDIVGPIEGRYYPTVLDYVRHLD